MKMDENELLKIAVKLKDSKKIKKDFKDQIKVFDSLKGILGASNVERMKLPMEFENDKNLIIFMCKIPRFEKTVKKIT